MAWTPTIVGEGGNGPHDGSGTEPEEQAPETDWLGMAEAPDEEQKPEDHWRWRFAHAAKNITGLLNTMPLEEQAQVAYGLAQEFAARARPAMAELGWALTFPPDHPLIDTKPAQSLSEIRLFTSLAQACSNAHIGFVTEIRARAENRERENAPRIIRPPDPSLR